MRATGHFSSDGPNPSVAWVDCGVYQESVLICYRKAGGPQRISKAVYNPGHKVGGDISGWLEIPRVLQSSALKKSKKE